MMMINSFDRVSAASFTDIAVPDPLELRMKPSKLLRYNIDGRLTCI